MSNTSNFFKDISDIRVAAAAAANTSEAAGIEKELEKPTINSKFVKTGQYGCVLRPALPNKNESGVWHKYPENITKIYYNPESANKAEKNSEQIQKILGENNGLKIHRYKHQYTPNNLPLNIRNSCHDISSKKIVTLRQKDLGIDIIDYSKPKYADLLEQYRSLPVSKFLEQVQKLFHQVANLVKNKYIHGDIRETNILINPKTGEFTIIDFDWLYPVYNFFMSYPVGTFYSNPPESLMYVNFDVLPRDINLSNPAKVEQFIKVLSLNSLEKISKKYMNAYKFYFNHPSYTAQYLIRKLVEDLDYLEENGIQTKFEFRNYLAKTFDVWGLALSLRIFINIVWPDPRFMPLPVLDIYEIILKINKFSIEERLSLDEAIVEINRVIQKQKNLNNNTFISPFNIKNIVRKNNKNTNKNVKNNKNNTIKNNTIKNNKNKNTIEKRNNKN